MVDKNPVTISISSAYLLENESRVNRYGTTNSEENPADCPQSCTGFGSRHVFALTAFFGLAAVYMMRVNLFVAIVDMVRTPAHFPYTVNTSQTTDLTKQFCPVKSTNYRLGKDGEFDWDSKTQGLILGSFFWGYTITQLPGAILSRKLGGGKIVFGMGVLLTGLFSLLTPIAARSNVKTLILVRIMTGLAEGVTLPAMHQMLSDWVPVEERSTIGAFVLAGMQFGTVVALPLSGFLCDLELDKGWPLAFYVPGFLGIVWFVVWWWTVSDNPEIHPRISDEERHMILSSIGSNGQQNSTPPTPWWAMVTSIHVWAILVAHIGKAWGFSVLLTELPTYLKTVLHFDMKANSSLSAMPYMAMWLFSMGFSLIADAVQKKKLLNTTQTRKLFNSIGFMAPALAFVGASYTGCNATATVTLLTVATGFIGAVYSGFEINHIDIAPTHAGILMGVTNSLSSTCGFAAPYVVGLVVTKPGSVDQWRIIFLLSAAVYVITNLFYVLFATGEEQKWNSSEDLTKETLSRRMSSKTIKDH